VRLDDDEPFDTRRRVVAGPAFYLQLPAGFTLPEAARRLGHGPGLHLQTYAHVIDALDGKRYADLDALIAAARADLVLHQSCTESAERD
jgi:hypothetical protein